MGDEIGVDVERMHQMASAMENLRDVLAANVPVIVNTMNGHWSGGTGQPVSLLALQQAVGRSVDDASTIAARAQLAVAYQDQADTALPAQWVKLPWDTSATQADDDSDFKQAAIAGAKAAKDFQDGKLTEPEFLTLLGEHEDDPGWQTAAMRVIGSTGIWNIYESSGFTFDKANLQPLALAVAAAMAHGVAFHAPAGVSGQAGEQEAASESVLAPLLAYANFPPKVLLTLGGEAMQPDYDQYAPQIFAALAKDPKLASLFVQQNAPQIVTFLSGENPAEPGSGNANAFLPVLKAATIGSKSTDPQGSADAVTALVNAYDKNPNAHTTGAYQGLYAKIVEDYWPDVQAEITNMTGVDGVLPTQDGTKLTLHAWTAFIDEAMRNPQACKSLMQCAAAASTPGWKTWARLNIPTAGQDAGGPQGDTTDDGAVGLWDSRTIVHYFNGQAKTVYSQLVAEGLPPQWLETIQGDATSDAFQALPAAGDPAAAAATGGAGALQQLTQKFPWLLPAPAIGLLEQALTPGPPSSKPYEDIPMPGGSSYATKAMNIYNVATPEERESVGALASAKGFLDGNPPDHIPQPDSMTPEQLAAFNAWLHTWQAFQYFQSLDNSPSAKSP
jgi:hypothetical protein